MHRRDILLPLYLRDSYLIGLHVVAVGKQEKIPFQESLLRLRLRISYPTGVHSKAAAVKQEKPEENPFYLRLLGFHV